jgi:tetratricopeptide (TPR) repeat protein
MNETARNLQQVRTIPYLTNVDRWAIIVGISKYKDESMNLKYADRDAEELYNLLLEPLGGGFKEDHIKKLLNEEATTAEITKALRSFLKKAGKDDIVTLYFACHGSPDMDRPNNIYLLTYDTDPRDISGTALPMREIDQSLKENLNAERVIIIADTCHSAAIGGRIGSRNACNDAQAINVYLQEVSKAKGGVALLTSAEANESSLEDELWGGGHGVFTHFLLQGMRGDADGYGQPKDGIVTVGELFDYVREKVRKETDNKQHPTIGTNPFDRNLPMAVSSGINVQEHYKLGLSLYKLGWILDDTKRFQAAAEQFSEAIRLSEITKTPYSEAELGLGKAHIASDNYDEAIKVLSSLIERDGPESSPEAFFYLGIAQAKRRDYPAVESTFEQFLAHCPEDENNAWVREYIRWLNSNIGGRKYALLIGINKYTLQKMSNLEGCLNDVMFMKKILTQQYGFEETNVLTLLDKDATYQGILNALESLSQKVAPADTVVVYYSGHSIPEIYRENWEVKPNEDPYLVVNDTTYSSGYLSCSISSAELHLHMNAIPAVNKMLILDTHPSSRFIEMAEKEGNYTLLLSTDSAEVSYELPLKKEGKAVQMGLFTGVLTQLLEDSNPRTLTYGELLDATIAKIRVLGFDQIPLLIGDREQLIFAREDIYLNIFEFAQRRNYTSIEPESLHKLYIKYQNHEEFKYPLMDYSFGCAFLEKLNYDTAINALQAAVRQRNGNYPEAVLALGKAQFSARCDSDALINFRQYAAKAPEEMAESAKLLIERTEKLVSGTKHALLVGTSDYFESSVMPVQNAVNDVLALKKILLEKFGFKENDIKVLLNSDATCTAIMEAFKQLVEKAREEPALFYFAGSGSVNADSVLTIASEDEKQEQACEIEIRELAELSGNNAPNLIAIVDADWKCYHGAVKGNRTVYSDKRERWATRDISEFSKLDQAKLRIGFLSIYAHSPEYSLSTAASMSKAKFKATKSISVGKPFDTLTRALVQSLNEADAKSLTYSKLFDSVSKQLEPVAPVVLGEYFNKLVFDSRTLRCEILELVTRLMKAPIFETIKLLIKMTEQCEQQGNSYPEGLLNLGMAYSAVGDYEKSIQALERAIALYTDPAFMTNEKEKNPYAEDHYHETRYQLGHVLFESGYDLSRAVSEAQEATQLDPENARAYYYLGQAIRAMVESETLAKAENALQIYLEKGAPLGHEDEVRKFLRSRLRDTLIGNEGRMQEFPEYNKQEVKMWEYHG